MGSISFLLPNPSSAAALASLREARFVVGEDQVPVPTELEFDDGRFVASCTISESRYLMLPWPIDPAGRMVVTTSTLRETPEPYRLLVELARGKLNQVRTLAADWHGMGLRLNPDFETTLADITRTFGQSLHGPSSGNADERATHVLEQSVRLGDGLVREFISQMFDTRHHEEGMLETRLAARAVGAPSAEYARSFNASQFAIRWRSLEPEEARYDWTATDRAVAEAKRADLPITCGPVIDLAPGLLPDWVATAAGDVPTLAAFMCDFLETVIERYQDDVRRWVVCTGFNHANSLGLGDDDRQRLAFRLFEAAAHIDPNLELILGVAQPWGDYRSNPQLTLPPLSYADDLIRSGLRLSAVELEIQTGTEPRGSLPRDLMDIARLLNLFEYFGLPLEVVLSQPAGSESDPNAVSGETVWQPGWSTGPTPITQADWGSAVAALALCLPQVRAVTWEHWSDTESHRTPHAGLVDASGSPRPLLERLRTLRVAHLR